ncbi:hypothetical protein I317_02024 [Kwoniella heveanensis CBS 569]|nr:hypothetical protein I317_02024 [Kwoniella heveanensis CBS 569]
MADKQAAASGGRPTWDKEEWAAKAKAKDEQNAEYAKAAEQAMAEGKLPPRRKLGDDLPAPTKKLEFNDARKSDMDLNKNLNKTMLVQTSTTGKGPRGAGFYCEMCDRTFKDSLSYLDHINGRTHLRMLGMTTQVERSTLTQVRAKIASLRAATANAVTAKNFDFNQRLKSVKEAEEVERQRRREERKRKREKRREDEELTRMGILRDDADARDVGIGAENGVGGGKGSNNKKRKTDQREADRRKAQAEQEVERAIQERDDMAAMMGFGGFGGSSKRK